MGVLAEGEAWRFAGRRVVDPATGAWRFAGRRVVDPATGAVYAKLHPVEAARLQGSKGHAAHDAAHEGWCSLLTSWGKQLLAPIGQGGPLQVGLMERRGPGGCRGASTCI